MNQREMERYKPIYQRSNRRENIRTGEISTKSSERWMEK
jgi:hypothetical protein